MNFSFFHTVYNFCKDSELILDGMVLRIQKLFSENKPQTGSFLLSGPHSIVNKMAETQNNLLRGWETLRTNQIKLNFFNKCKEKHVIPNGLKVNFNLAVGCKNGLMLIS